MVHLSVRHELTDERNDADIYQMAAAIVVLNHGGRWPVRRRLQAIGQTLITHYNGSVIN